MLSDVKFADLEGVHELTKRALSEVMGFECLTQVQAATLPLILKGRDVLAKARTGTGKTVGFLLPCVEQIIAMGPAAHNGMQIPVLIISPTRELSNQIAAEAKLLTHFFPSIRVECFVGGTNVKTDQRIMAREPVQILVATPGRLLDLLANTRGVKERFSKLCVFVLDEADQLLEMGFRPDLTRIIKLLPNRNDRQSLLFSATVPNGLHEIKHLAMRDDCDFVDTVGEDEQQTHLHVRQQYVVCTLQTHIMALEHVLTQHIAKVCFALRLCVCVCLFVCFFCLLVCCLSTCLLRVSRCINRSRPPPP
jgi:ATP-dependent RNA helicase MSS116